MFNWPITVHVLFRSVLITNTLNSLAEERVADILARTRPPPHLPALNQVEHNLSAGQ